MSKHLHHTSGIILNYIKFKETSIICKIYTEAFGLQSYIVKGVRSVRSKKLRMSYFQPLTLCELVVYRSPKSDLHHISEVKIGRAYHSIPFDVKKTSVALFLSEILTKVLVEEGDPPLFSFLFDSFCMLDELKAGSENFHLYFILHLCPFLGFALEQHTAEILFDQVHHKPILKELMGSIYPTQLSMSAQSRHELLQQFLQFYELHFGLTFPLKTIEVLQEVFR